MDLFKTQKKFDKSKMHIEVIEKHENMSTFKEIYIKSQIGLALLKHPRNVKKRAKKIEAKLNYKFHGGWTVVVYNGTKLKTREFIKGLFKRGLTRSISFLKMIILNQEKNYMIVQDENHIYCIYQKKYFH